MGGVCLLRASTRICGEVNRVVRITEDVSGESSKSMWGTLREDSRNVLGGKETGTVLFQIISWENTSLQGLNSKERWERTSRNVNGFIDKRNNLRKARATYKQREILDLQVKGKGGSRWKTTIGLRGS